MFHKSKNALILRGESAVPTLIASDISIIGNLVSEGVVEVAGRIEGNVKCDVLNLHPTGLIKGDVIAAEAKINGEIHGVVKGKKVNLAEKAKLHGFLIYETLSVAPGAVMFGQIKQDDRDDIAEDHVQAVATNAVTTPSSAPAPIAAAAPATIKEAASSSGSGGRKMRLVNKE